MSKSKNLLLHLTALSTVLLLVSQPLRVFGQTSSTTAAKRPAGAHQDHNPKHGGTFFMALDNRHHLEGVLLPSGAFHVYLYDSHTHPVGLAELKQAKGNVQWGEAANSPVIPLTVAKNGEYLEAVPSSDKVKPPIELTLRLQLPGQPANAKPELFTFPFSHYTEDHASAGGQEHAEHEDHADHAVHSK